MPSCERGDGAHGSAGASLLTRFAERGCLGIECVEVQLHQRAQVDRARVEQRLVLDEAQQDF